MTDRPTSDAAVTNDAPRFGSEAARSSLAAAKPKPSTQGPLRGFINIDKPAGITSFDVVRQIRHSARIKKVGHAGVLDQPATGVLPVAVGDATRLIEEVMSSRKRYRATVRLGQTTDTYDAAGAVTSEAAPGAVDAITEDQVLALLDQFRGEFDQVPPAYSSIKRAGEPAHRAARRGEDVEMEPRPIVVYDLRLTSFDLPRVELELECGKGFYVRSLAHDLGALLGVGGHVETLRRTGVGVFREEDAYSLNDACDLLESGEWEGLVHAPDAVLTHWPALLLGRGGVQQVRMGRDILPIPATRLRTGEPGERARCYGPDGHLVALVEATAPIGGWHPYRVFPPPQDQR